MIFSLNVSSTLSSMKYIPTYYKSMAIKMYYSYAYDNLKVKFP